MYLGYRYITGCEFKQKGSFHITSDSSLLFVAGAYVVLQKNKLQKHISLFDQKTLPATEDVTNHLHNFQITSCAFNRDANIFAVSMKVFGGDIMLKVVSLEKKTVFRNFIVAGDILSSSFSLDGKFLSCLVHCDGTYLIHIWDLKSSKLFSTNFVSIFPSDESLKLTEIQFGGNEADGRCLALFTKNTVRFINFNPEYVKSLKPCSSKNPHFDEIAFTQWLNGTKILVAGEHCLYTFDKRGEKTAVSVDPDFRIVGFYDSGVIVNNGSEQKFMDYDHTAHALVLKKTLSTGTLAHVNVVQAAVSKSGNTVAIISSDGQILFNKQNKNDKCESDVIKTWETIQRFHIHEVKHAAYESVKGQLMTVDAQNYLYSWDFETNAVKFMQEMEESPQGIQIHPSGKLLLIGFPHGFAQYIITPTNLTKQSSKRIPSAIDTKYNHLGSLLLSYTKNNVAIFTCLNLQSVCQLQTEKNIQSAAWVSEFVVEIKYFDNSVEVYQINNHLNEYTLEEKHDIQRLKSAETPAKFAWNSIIEHSSNSNEIHICVTNRSEINGILRLKDSAFMTYAKDCNLMFFNIKQMQEELKKNNSILDEIFLLPKVYSEVKLSINSVLDELTEIKRKYNERTDELNSQHRVLLDNIKTEKTLQQEHLTDLFSNYEKQLQKLVVQNNSILKSLFEKQETNISKLNSEHSAELNLALKQIDQLEEVRKITDLRAEEKLNKLTSSFEETEKIQRSQFDRDVQQLNEKCKELEGKIVDETKRSDIFHKNMDAEVSKELDEVQYNFHSEIAAETKANVILKQIRDQTAVGYKKVTDLKAEKRACLDQQHEVLSKLNLRLAVIQSQEKSLLQTRKDKGSVMDQKDDEALDLENSIKQVERNLFMIESELKSLEASENPRRELLERYQTDAKEMREEIRRLVKSISDWHRINTVIESKIKVLQHRFREHNQIYSRAKNNVELVIVDEMKRALDIEDTTMDQHKIIRKLIEDMQRDETPGTFPGRRNSREQIEDNIAITMHIQETMSTEKIRQKKSMVKSSKERDQLLGQRQFLMEEIVRLRVLAEQT